MAKRHRKGSKCGQVSNAENKYTLQSESQLMTRLTGAPRLNHRVYCTRCPRLSLFYANKALGQLFYHILTWYKLSYQTPCLASSYI